MSLPVSLQDRSGYVEGEHTLRADMELYPEAKYSCPITELDEDVEEIRFNAMEGECHVDLVLSDGRVVRATDEIREKACFCSIFQRFGSVPHYNGIDNGIVQVSTYLEDHTDLRKLIQGLREVSDTVRLVRLTAIDDETGSRTFLLDLSVLTDKQYEALELAVGSGYYDNNGVDMNSLASELNISAAAFSQRLKRAQANLANELVG